jgi:16S rRNA processing protein RimM
MGRIAAPYGVQGWCRIQPLSEDPQALLEHRTWWIECGDAGSEWEMRAVNAARMHGQALIAKLVDVATREDALGLRGRLVGVPRELLPRGEGEFFWSELVGFEVVNRAGVLLGVVTGLSDTGAHPVLRVQSEATEHLIPWVPVYVEAVDAPARRIVVDWEADY